jgi:hypothetical protein
VLKSLLAALFVLAIAGSIPASAPRAQVAENQRVEKTVQDQELATKGSILSFDIPPISIGYIKVFVSGKLAAQGRNHGIVMRVNDIAKNYMGFVLQNGRATPGEWDGAGFFLGRSGWNIDADFLCEITLAINASEQTVIGSGLTTFVDQNNKAMIGYEWHGLLATDFPVRSLSVGFLDGATMTAHARYQIY